MSYEAAARPDGMAQITACSTLGFCNFPLDVAARQIARRGFKKIELCHLGVYCLHYTIGRDDPHGVRRIKSYTKDAPGIE